MSESASVDIIAGFVAGVGGVAGVWAAMRFILPPVAALVSSLWSTKIELDEDRDRVISNLRAEVEDLYRRLKVETAAKEQAEQQYNEYKMESERRVAEVTARVSECEAFIRRYIQSPQDAPPP